MKTVLLFGHWCLEAWIFGEGPGESSGTIPGIVVSSSFDKNVNVACSFLDSYTKNCGS
jgi:hypothetical protein